MPKVTEAYLETRRQHILDAAIACFARKGFHQTTMEDIGQEAGLSPGLAYRYFDGKEDIILATIEDSLERSERFFELRADEENTLSVLEQMIDNQFHRLKQPGRDSYYKVRVQLWAEALQNPKVAEKARLLRQQGLKQSARLIRRGQEKGQINRDLDAMAVSLALAACHDGFILHWLADPGVDIRQYRNALMAMVRGLTKHHG
jgi:TetR/AcrR family transcriptional repressor of uid operon